jgi:hypothetical protein
MSGIAPISLRSSGVWHTVEKVSMRTTTLLQTSFQSKVCRRNYGPPKLRESQLWEFRGSHLGVLGQNVIWMLVSWPATEYTIRGKVMASLKSGSWWVLWIWVCPSFVLTPKVFQLYTNQLVVGFMQVCVSDWLLVILPSFIPELQHAPLPPKCYKLRNMPQLLTLPLFSLQTHIWIYQRI